MSAMAPYLIFSVGMGAVGVYTIGRRGRRIHRGRVGGGYVGSRVLRRGRHSVRSGFGGVAVGREAARQRRRERA